MGVKGLWTLLSACGRCIPLDALTTRVLAIDVSLWLVQFLKAMRLEDGQVRRDAHLIGSFSFIIRFEVVILIPGMFRRICRLLIFGIRPVFVFDGPPPMLKRRTLASRRRLRDASEQRWKRTAEKILLTQLKLKTIQELKAQIEQAGNSADDSEQLKELAAEDEEALIEQATREEFADLFVSEDDDGDSLGSDDGDLAIPENIDITDPSSLAALPYSMQFEILERMREDRAQESR